MKKVLITGATGFIGRHCLSFLKERNYEVHAVSSTHVKPLDNGIHWHQVNLLDQNSIAPLLQLVKPTHLLHLAWYAVPGKLWQAPENLEWVKASIHLLKVFAEQGGKRAVIAGTCAEYDWNYGYCTENLTPLSPHSLYGVCKNALHEITRSFSAQAGLSYAWGRVFYLYGPYEHTKRLVSSIIRSLLLKEEAACTHGTQVRDFLHVEDAADAFVSILESEVQGPVNIASGTGISLKELIYKIGEKAGNKNLIQIGKLTAPLNDPSLLLANTNRLQKEVGWKPQMTLDAGLDHTISWWIEHLFPSSNTLINSL